MKRTLIAVASAVAILAMVVGGLGSARASTGRALSGTLNVSGSTALLPLVNQAAQDFMQANSGVTINVSGGGSGTGLAQAQSGAVDIGDSDVYADPKNQPDLVDHHVAVVTFAVVVNKSVGLKNLTQQQLYNIYAAPYSSKDRLDNWSQAGGPNLKTVVVVRPTSSGTRKTFDKIVLKGAYEKGTAALQKDSTNLVLQTVAQTRGAIGYAALGNAETQAKQGNVIIASYNGVDPTVRANLVTYKYKIMSYEHMYTKGKASTLAQAFIGFLTSSGYKSTVDKLGFIPIGDMKATIK